MKLRQKKGHSKKSNRFVPYDESFNIFFTKSKIYSLLKIHSHCKIILFLESNIQITQQYKKSKFKILKKVKHVTIESRM